jgi:hypothetical protein
MLLNLLRRHRDLHQISWCISQKLLGLVFNYRACLVTKAYCCQFDHSGNTKGGTVTVPLTSCLTDLESAV